MLVVHYSRITRACLFLLNELYIIYSCKIHFIFDARSKKYFHEVLLLLLKSYMHRFSLESAYILTRASEHNSCMRVLRL